MTNWNGWHWWGWRRLWWWYDRSKRRRWCNRRWRRRQRCRYDGWLSWANLPQWRFRFLQRREEYKKRMQNGYFPKNLQISYKIRETKKFELYFEQSILCLLMKEQHLYYHHCSFETNNVCWNHFGIIIVFVISIDCLFLKCISFYLSIFVFFLLLFDSSMDSIDWTNNFQTTKPFYLMSVDNFCFQKKVLFTLVFSFSYCRIALKTYNTLN